MREKEQACGFGWVGDGDYQGGVGRREMIISIDFVKKNLCSIIKARYLTLKSKWNYWTGKKKQNSEANFMSYTKILFNLSTSLNRHMQNFNENVLPCVATLGSDLGFVSFFDGRLNYTKIFHKDVNAVSTFHQGW